MTQTSNLDRDRAEDEAVGWLILFSDGPVDAETEARFHSWREESAINAEIWIRTSKAYDLIGKGAPRHSEHWLPYLESRPRPPVRPEWRIDVALPSPRRRIRRIASGLSAIAVAACLAMVVAPWASLELQSDLVTGTAELGKQVLADGTHLHLAPETSVATSQSDPGRRVKPSPAAPVH